MRVKNVDTSDLTSIVRAVSQQRYQGNIVIRDYRNEHNSRGLRSRFTIKAVNSREPGARRSWSGRRMPVACWHAHWHVLDLLFRRHPDAEVTTALARYTADTFRERAAETAYVNAGSAWMPTRYPDLCDCSDLDWVRDTSGPDVIGHRVTTAVASEPVNANDMVVRNSDGTVRPAKVLREQPESLENRIAREVAEAERQQRMWMSSAYSWKPGDTHLYDKEQ